ncbi:MAG: sugar kinase [Betaproteobacteria bacterium]
MSQTPTAKPQVLTLGEPLVEFNQTSPSSQQYLQGFGGDVSTVAIAAARYGCSAAIITAIGNDPFGDLLRDLWQREGVATSFVMRDANAHTGVYFVSHTDAGHRFSYLRSGSAASRITPEQLPTDAIRAARWLHVSAISQAISASSHDTVSAAIATAKAAGTHISYDPNLRLALWPAERARETIRSTAAHADLFLPSLEDILTLTGLGSAEEALQWCIDTGARQIILKLGDRGVLASIAGERVTLAPHRVDRVDATGAGDCFAGTLLAGLCAGESITSAISTANAAAALSTTGFGAVAPLPTRAEVQHWLSSRQKEVSDVIH